MVKKPYQFIISFFYVITERAIEKVKDHVINNE